MAEIPMENVKETDCMAEARNLHMCWSIVCIHSVSFISFSVDQWKETTAKPL